MVCFLRLLLICSFVRVVCSRYTCNIVCGVVDGLIVKVKGKQAGTYHVHPQMIFCLAYHLLLIYEQLRQVKPSIRASLENYVNIECRMRSKGFAVFDVSKKETTVHCEGCSWRMIGRSTFGFFVCLPFSQLSDGRICNR